MWRGGGRTRQATVEADADGVDHAGHAKQTEPQASLSAPTPSEIEPYTYGAWLWDLSEKSSSGRSVAARLLAVLTPSIDTLRLFLHVLAASVWVGGQFVLAGIVPRLRGFEPDEAGSTATNAAANGFARVAWPAFAVAFVTGIWNLLEVESATTDYHVTLGLKILLTTAAGFSAFFHSRASTTVARAATGALGAAAGVAVLFLGVLLGNAA